VTPSQLYAQFLLRRILSQDTAIPCTTTDSRPRVPEIESHMEQTPTQLAETFAAYLDNIAVLDDCSQQLSVLRFVLFLLQICRMLKLKENNSIAGCFIKKKVTKHLRFFKSISKKQKNNEHLKQRNFLSPTSISVISNSLVQLFRKIDTHHLSNPSFG